MKTNSTLKILLAALLLAAAAFRAQAQATPPGLVPPTETYAGKTHAQWLESWFTWMFSIPGGAQDFPFTDPTGANSGANQSGPVFFFAKSWLGVKGNPSEQRSATVPEGTALFLPFNGYYIDPNPDRDPATITAENRAALNDWGTQVFKLVVDGEEIPVDSSLTSPILHATSVYTLSIPANAAARPVGYGKLPETVYPFQSYEWFVLLKPLPVGRHVVHLFNNGFIGTPDEWVSDVVWTIDVVARPLSRDVIATSATEFSGFRDVAGWSYGHRTAPAAGASENYDPARDFIPFSGGPAQGDWDGQRQQWNGTAWKAKDGTELAAGSSRLAAANRWTLRRWQASELLEKSPVALRWTLAKADATCGNGVTGALHINGQLVDKATIPFDRADALTRTFYALLTPGDVVDLALRPLGADGTDDLGCDSALMTLSVSTAIPNFPRQPDNKLFLTSLPTRKLEILSQSTANGRSTVNWSSQASATYGIQASGDLSSWTKLASGLPGNPTATRWSEPLTSPEQPARFYRVVEESKTIEGLWVAFYEGNGYELIRITVDGDQAVATKLIGDTYIRSGEVTWEADVKTGLGQQQVAAGSDFQGREWVSGTLKITNSDRLTFTWTGVGTAVFRRVD